MIEKLFRRVILAILVIASVNESVNENICIYRLRLRKMKRYCPDRPTYSDGQVEFGCVGVAELRLCQWASSIQQLYVAGTLIGSFCPYLGFKR